MSFLSIPALCNKKIGTLFLPGKAIIFDLENNCMELGIAMQREDGLFYIPDTVKSGKEWNEGHSQGKEIAAMMAVAKREYAAHGLREEKTTKIKCDSTPREDMTFGTKKKRNLSTEARCEVANDSKNQMKRQAEIWYLRLCNSVPIKSVIRLIIEGLLPSATCKEPACDSCAKGKYLRNFTG